MSWVAMVLLPVVSATDIPDCPHALCQKMEDRVQSIGVMLRTVSDKESADRAAQELRPMMQQMQNLMQHLARMPQSTPDSVREIATSMRCLMHATQMLLPTIQRIHEVNAYGSEELMRVFIEFKFATDGAGMSATATTRSETEIAYAEWAEALEDVVFLLRHIRDDKTLNDTLVILDNAVDYLEDCRKVGYQLLHRGRTPVITDSDLPVIQRLRQFRENLTQECIRLKAADYCNSSQLQELVERCMNQQKD